LLTLSMLIAWYRLECLWLLFISRWFFGSYSLPCSAT
jgi:hypothetical protein